MSAGGKERRGDRLWRAAGFCAEWKALLRACPANVPEAGRNNRQKDE